MCMYWAAQFPEMLKLCPWIWDYDWIRGILICRMNEHWIITVYLRWLHWDVFTRNLIMTSWKEVRHRTSHGISRHSLITTVWWYSCFFIRLCNHTLSPLMFTSLHSNIMTSWKSSPPENIPCSFVPFFYHHSEVMQHLVSCIRQASLLDYKGQLT